MGERAQVEATVGDGGCGLRRFAEFVAGQHFELVGGGDES